MITVSDIQEALQQLNAEVEGNNPHLDFKGISSSRVREMVDSDEKMNGPDSIEFDEGVYEEITNILSRNIPALVGIREMDLVDILIITSRFWLGIGAIIGRKQAAKAMEEFNASL